MRLALQLTATLRIYERNKRQKSKDFRDTKPMLGDRSGTTQCQPRRQPQAHRGSLLAAETEARVSRRQRHVSPVNQKKKNGEAGKGFSGG